MSAATISLAMVNANVLTMDPGRPKAKAVAISGDRIAAVGSTPDIRRLASRRTQVIDCQGQTLLPGFNDAHIHLPGLARRLQDLDCTPQAASSIVALQSLIRQWTDDFPAATWVRGFGYDDLQLADRRHPDRHDLDAAAPRHPAWLQHRSGHASVLNSLALEAAGIHRETPDPPGGVIERDELTGDPTGVLFESQELLRQRLRGLRSAGDFDSGMRAVGRLLASYGITSVQDAGAYNGIERWITLRRLQSEGALPCHVTMFAGIERLEELLGAGVAYGSGDHCVRLGHAKIMLTLTSGKLHPDYTELEAMVAAAHSLGFPVAVHCVEEQAIGAAAAVLEGNKESGLGDRLEHCSEGTPEIIDAVRRSGATVATQPGFLYHNGTSYRQNVAGRLLPHLYPAGSLIRAGATTAFGSDAPVIDPNPWPAIYSAVTRRTSEGQPLNGEIDSPQTISVEQALRAYTLGSAEAEGTLKHKGSVTPGNLADLALVDADPMSIDPENLPAIRTVLTIIAGSVDWGNSKGRVGNPPL